MRKILKSLFRLLVLLALLAYTALYWRSLRGVEAFLQLYPTNAKIEYDWLVPWFDGKARLFGIRIYNQRNESIVHAKQLIIDLKSLKTLMTAKELLSLRDFPQHTSFYLKDATTTDAFKAGELFDYFPQLDMTHALLPTACQNLSFEPRPFRFDGHLQVFFDVTASSIDWQAEIDSADFSRIKMRLKQANFVPLSGEKGYVDEWHMEISDPLWLNQLNQQCAQQLQLSPGAEGPKEQETVYQQQLKDFALANNWNLNPDFSQQFAHWLALPGKLTIDFDPPKGVSFQQLAEAGVDNFPALTGLRISFDEQVFREFFAAKDYISDMQQTASQAETSSVESPPPVTPEFLPAKYTSLRGYLDAKVEVRLNSKRKITGYIRKVEQAGFQLEVREAKGSSLLPFAYTQVSAIRLIRPGS